MFCFFLCVERVGTEKYQDRSLVEKLTCGSFWLILYQGKVHAKGNNSSFESFKLKYNFRKISKFHLPPTFSMFKGSCQKHIQVGPSI